MILFYAFPKFSPIIRIPPLLLPIPVPFGFLVRGGGKNPKATFHNPPLPLLLTPHPEGESCTPHPPPLPPLRG